jgi:hypothetical protein
VVNCGADRTAHHHTAGGDSPRGELRRGSDRRSPHSGRTIAEVESHQRIPELFGDETNVRRWVRIKQEPWSSA